MCRAYRGASDIRVPDRCPYSKEMPLFGGLLSPIGLVGLCVYPSERLIVGLRAQIFGVPVASRGGSRPPAPSIKALSPSPFALRPKP